MHSSFLSVQPSPDAEQAPLKPRDPKDGRLKCWKPQSSWVWAFGIFVPKCSHQGNAELGRDHEKWHFLRKFQEFCSWNTAEKATKWLDLMVLEVFSYLNDSKPWFPTNIFWQQGNGSKYLQFGRALKIMSLFLHPYCKGALIFHKRALVFHKSLIPHFSAEVQNPETRQLPNWERNCLTYLLDWEFSNASKGKCRIRINATVLGIWKWNLISWVTLAGISQENIEVAQVGCLGYCWRSGGWAGNR